MKLYGYWRSSSSWRVRIVLGLKGLEYENVPVHLVKNGGEQNRPEYLEINPAGQVPTLEVRVGGDVRRLTQSLVIFDYLDRVQPSPPLWPEDEWLAYRARQCAEICNSSIQPLHNSSVLAEVERLGGARPAWVQHFVPRGLRALEAVVAEFGGRYCIGDAITGADACLPPQLFAARRFGVDLSPYPNLCRVDASLAEHPAFQAARPEHQPDAVPA